MSGKIKSLQILRAMAFLGILTYHCEATNLGAWGVSVFLIMSGFLMVYNHIHSAIPCGMQNQASYARKKLRKLYPLHILMLIMILILLRNTLFHNLSIKSSLTTGLKIVSNVFLLQSWIPNSKYYYAMNGVSWYLSVMAFIYFVFPIILKNIQQKGTPFVIKLFTGTLALQVVISVLTCLVQLPDYALLKKIDDLHKYVTYICPAFRLGDFCLGCCLGYAFCHSSKSMNTVPATILELAVLLYTVLFGLKIITVNANIFGYDLMYVPTSILLVWLFAAGNGFITKTLASCKPLLFLGNLSGYTFIMHQVIIRYVDKITGKLSLDISYNPWIKALIILALSVLAATAYRKAESIVFSIKGRRTGKQEMPG